jgi:outer membrane protein
MKKAFVLGALGLSMVVLGMVRASAAAPSGPPKIGYIDLQHTINETKAGKAARQKLEADKAQKQKKIDTMKDEVKQMAADLDKQRVVLKPEALAAKEKELQEKYVNLQQQFMELQQALAKSEAQLTKEIFVKAQSIIESIAKRDGYTMILEKNESAILFADPSLNITKEVNERLDKGEGGK